MKITLARRVRLSMVALVSLVLPSSYLSTIAAAAEMPEWGQAEADAFDALSRPDASLPGLVRSIDGQAPKSGQEAMFRASVYLRAGMNAQAIQAFRELKRLAPEVSGAVVSQIYYSCCDRRQAWDVAQAVCEIFDDRVLDIGLENRLIKHMQESGRTVDEIDAWLAARPSGVDNFWIKERLRFNAQNERGAAIEKQLADRVRANPTDAKQAIAFLDALTVVPREPQATPDLTWMADVVRPRLATEAARIAELLNRLSAKAAAVAFYRKAIDIPLTDDDLHELSRNSQAVRPAAATAAGFAAGTREALARCLVELNRADEAQKWMVEAADLREKNNLGRNALVAGQVQAASGAREIESRIAQAEPLNESNPQYWQERAQYYRGRKESAREEEALKKGLELSPPLPEPRGKSEPDLRSSFFNDYARFLVRENRELEALALLRKELAEAPVNTASSDRAARLLGFGIMAQRDFTPQLSAEDPVVWAWLEKRPNWSHTEERLLWRTLEAADSPAGNQPGFRRPFAAERDLAGNAATTADMERAFARAEQIANQGDASRAAVLGWVLNRMSQPARSIPLLEQAFAATADSELKQKVAFSLFESHLDLGDWRKAEAIFPAASQRLTRDENIEWYGRIAVLAAKANDKQDALRLWRRVAGIDMTETRHLQPLSRAGLRDELITYYQVLQQALPASSIPPKVIAELRNL